MTSEQKAAVESLRSQGLGYRKIAIETGISENTLKSYLRRTAPERPVSSPTQTGDEPSAVAESVTKPCHWCGKPVPQNPGRKEKKFCSDECRNRWWNKNKYLMPRKSLHSFLCPTCGREFSAYGTSTRKYCSHACYISGRFHGGAK